MSSPNVQTRGPEPLLVIIDEQQQEITWLKEQLRLMKHRRFGATHEAINALQVPLFPINEGEFQDCLDKAKHDTTTIASHPRRRPVRPLISPTMERERVEIDLSDEEKICPCCASTMTKIDEEISRKIEFVPASLKLREYARFKYACKQCQGHIQRAALPRLILPKSLISASLAAYLIMSKFVDHTPLHRIERQFQRLGFRLPRDLQCRALLALSEPLGKIVDCFGDDLRAGPGITTDDTILPLQNDIPGRRRTIQARLWVYQGGPPGAPPITVFRFTRSRAQAEPLAFLNGYQGYLTADGYPGYRVLFGNGQIQHVACNAHARRKFVEVIRATTQPHRAHEAIAIYKQLYQVEDVVKTLPLDQRSAYRQAHAVPILNQLETWLLFQQSAVLPKSKLGQAIRYCLHLWPVLKRYVEADFLKMDNNDVERIIRSAALGRKNWLFAGSVRGGEAAAVFYSLVETAKSHKLNVLHYLTDVLERLPYCKTTEDYRALTPNRWELGQHD